MQIKLFFIALVFKITLPLTIMLSPFGDAKTTGRIIDDCFERSLTLKFAEAVEKEIEKQNKNVQVILNRTPGETLEPLQNANFANRLNTDFYISIHFYKEKEARPKMFLFSYASDIFHTPINPNLTFVPFDEAFRININQTNELGKTFEDVLKQEKYKHDFDFKGLIKIPFRALTGVKAPNIAFEASLKSSCDWEKYIPTFVEGVNMVIKELK
jgi:hypothetical protein